MMRDITLRLTDRQWSKLNAIADTLRTAEDRERFVCDVARALASQRRPVSNKDILDAINTNKEKQYAHHQNDQKTIPQYELG